MTNHSDHTVKCTENNFYQVMIIFQCHERNPHNSCHNPHVHIVHHTYMIVVAVIGINHLTDMPICVICIMCDLDYV